MILTSNFVFRLESSIEDDYLNVLRQNCFREKSYSKYNKNVIAFSEILTLYKVCNKLSFEFAEENLLWQARYSGNSNLLNRAHNYQTPSCDQLEKIYSYN